MTHTTATPLPPGIAKLRSRKLRTGIEVYMPVANYFRNIRQDYVLSPSHQRTAAAFLRKYNIASCYHYSSINPGIARLEVTFRQ